MYWIVFALFSFAEAFTDYILIWFPFYYELKICFVLWLVLPATRGACVLYRKVVHPQLLKRETEIDANISKATDQGYAALITLGSRGFTLATNIVLSTAIKGSAKLSDQLQKSFSLNDLSGDNVDFRPRRRLEAPPSADDEEMENRLLSQQYRLEMASTQSLERIDDPEDGGSGDRTDEYNAQRLRRRQIESKLRDVMAGEPGEGPTRGRPVTRSSTLPRKFKTVSREVSSAIPEVSNEFAQDSPESSRSTSPAPSSPVSLPGSAPASAGVAAHSPPVSPSSPSSSVLSASVVVDSQVSSRDATSQFSAMQRLKMNFFSSKKK